MVLLYQSVGVGIGIGIAMGVGIDQLVGPQSLNPEAHRVVMPSNADSDCDPDPDSVPVGGHDSPCSDGTPAPAFSCPVLFHGIYNASDGIDVLYVLTPENL